MEEVYEGMVWSFVWYLMGYILVIGLNDYFT